MAILACSAIALQAQAKVDVGSFIRDDDFGDITISPSGEYYAATVPLEDRTGLVVMRRSDLTITASITMGKNSHVEEFTWVSPTRLIIGMSMKFGSEDTPHLTGELYGMNADGSGKGLLVGQRAQVQRAGTRIQPAKTQDVVATLIDSLKGEDDKVIVGISPFVDDPVTRAERMDVRNGRRTPITRAPVRNASFMTDNAGVVRFALGAASDNSNELYYRANDDSDWKLINDEAVSGRLDIPLGFSADDKIAYLQVERNAGPDAIVAYDTATGAQKELLRDAVVDPYAILYGLGNRVPVGAKYMQGKPRSMFFDEKSPEARLYRSLESAFPGESVHITSSTDDGRLALVQTYSDRNPGDFYLFDTASKKASHVSSRRKWFDPDEMGAMKPFEFKARDGTTVHGYLTLPPGSSGKNLATIVLPHGGPFGIQDYWGFDGDTQMLAMAGYAVLQPNFRGSGGYGRHFKVMGARQWGGSMQDDVTDATRWAIESGIADPSRICIYGASYGAFAALSGVAKEPGLYRCAVGYIGVYDLPMLFKLGDTQESKSGETYLLDWIGDAKSVAAVSPTNMADRIKTPVFLAAGGEDDRAPIAHSRLMERRLIAAGVPVETLYFDTEGHGFYTEPHRREFYEKLLAFFDRNLGASGSD
ncbi:MAG: S9 family peptidase [Lysobacteraceae bacterium]|nr:MAG: S9 family peptidase [Xanthomonadaceae bacterium]